MAVFNNGRITASVTPPNGYSGNYRYTLYIDINNTWTQYSAGNLQNPVTISSTQHVFGNPGATDENKEGDASWQGLEPGTYKVEVETLDGGLNCSVESVTTVGVDAPNDPCVGFNISENSTGETAITIEVTGGQAPFVWTLNGNSSTPANNGNGLFTFNGLTANTQYTIGIEDVNTCTDSVTATTDPVALSAFECGDTTITIANGTEGDAIPTSAVTATGVSNIIAVYETGTTTSATYIDGTQAVNVVFEVPGGYSNTGDSFTCSANATGTASGGGGGTNERTWYYFHGIDDNWLRYGGNSIFEAPSWGLFNNGTYSGNAATTLTEAMQHYFDNQGSLSTGYEILTYEMPTGLNITNNSGVTVLSYPALGSTDPNDADFFYMLIPNNADFPEDLTTSNLISYPAGAPGGIAAAREVITINGESYYLYQVQGGTSLGSVELTFV